ncbi:MAG: terminase TerL endonuclease subunit [Mesorhizobium sp.]
MRSPPIPTPNAAPASGPARQKLPLALEHIYRRMEVPEMCWGLPSGAIIAFCHGLRVPAGLRVGDELRLDGWQVEFVRDIYDVRHADGRRKRRQAILSVARRNGKTATSSALALSHLAGPMRRPGGIIYSAATSREQAEISYRYLRDMIRLTPQLGEVLAIVESRKRVVHRQNLGYYAAVSAESRGKYGVGVDVAIIDELAQHRTDELYTALRTSQGSQAEPLCLILGTQAADDTHFYSQMIDYGLKIRNGEFEDDSFTCHIYAADDGCDLDDKAQWAKANPALGKHRDHDELADTVTQASRSPGLESRVRNLYLNQRIAASAPYLSPSVWRLGSAKPDEALLYSGRPIYGGLDLSTTLDLTALTLAVSDDDGAIHLFPYVWTPGDTLDARASRDRAPYRAWTKNGFMTSIPGSAIDYDFVAQEIGELERKGVFFERINVDRWKVSFLKQSFSRFGVSVPLHDFGQGFKDMAPAVDMFEALALDGRLVHGNHPLLAWAVSNIAIERDAAGNRKATKAKSIGRIDPAIAAIMAVAAMKLQTEAEINVEAMIG